MLIETLYLPYEQASEVMVFIIYSDTIVLNEHTRPPSIDGLQNNDWTLPLTCLNIWSRIFLEDIKGLFICVHSCKSLIIADAKTAKLP